MEPRPKLEGFTDHQLEACARLVARRGNLRASLNGKDETDFVQEALCKVMDGERGLNPSRSLQENVVRIALSMLWNERQRRSAGSMSRMEVPAPFASELSSETISDLHAALRDAALALDGQEEKGRVRRDAAQFVACLTQQIERRGSIKPGHIATLLGMRHDRAYAAWRKVKAVLREQLERTET